MRTERKPRIALWAIGGFAIAGLLHLGAGIYWNDTRITVMGSGAVVFAFVLGLTTETFRARRYANAAPATSVPEAAPLHREIAYDYADTPATTRPQASAAAAWDPSLMRAPPQGVGAQPFETQDELVEFQEVEERQVPTRLNVPPAFEVETQVDSVLYGRQREVNVTTGAAMNRRKEIVNGLPILSSILAEEPPAATQIAPPANAGKTRGQCSACGTMIWAPKQRPIRLRCPRCGHVRTLTE